MKTILWRDQLKIIGIKALALELSLPYETVRRWHVGIAVPQGENLKCLISLVKRELGRKDFDAFVRSLECEIFGLED